MDDWELDENYTVKTSDFKNISEYTGLNFNEISDIPYYLFCLYKRDSWLYSLKRTQEGKEFLKELRDLMQTEPDYNSLRKVTKVEYV